MKTLVIFTIQFPYGKGEAFIESEFPFLCAAFDKVIIITNDLNTKLIRPVPGNVEIIRRPFAASRKYKLKALCSVFSNMVLNEIKFIRQRLKLKVKRRIAFILLASIAKGLETYDFVLKEIKERRGLNLDSTWFYSYWLFDSVVGLAMLKENFPEAKVFCRAHRWDLYFDTNEDNYLPLRPFLLSQLDQCFCISDDGQTYLQQLLGKENTSNVSVSRLGVKNEYGRQPFAAAETLTLVSCSSVTPPKRVNLIIDAISKITDRQIKWLHFGVGKLTSEIEDYAKRKLANKQNLDYRFMGYYSNSDLLKFYSQNQVDLFINVSSSEGIPVSIMEAMSFGIPVIATAAGGTTEIVKDGQNGYLLDVLDNAEQIATLIIQTADVSQDKMMALRENAFLTWNEKYNAEKKATPVLYRRYLVYNRA